MSIEATLRVLNGLHSAGAFSEYALGGAVAAFLYIEPGTTFDLDVFIAWKPGTGGLLSPGPLYAELKKLGYDQYEREAVVIEGWPVQFLPLGTALLEEALDEAVSIEIKSVPTRAFSKEHLMAICLQTGRPKDQARLIQMLEESAPDLARFANIVERNQLGSAWVAFQNRYGPST